MEYRISTRLTKLESSKFFTCLLQLNQSAEEVIFPPQYSDVYPHYLSYLSSPPSIMSTTLLIPLIPLIPLMPLTSLNQAKRCFELYQYLDDEQYFKVVLQQYFDYLVNPTLIQDINLQEYKDELYFKDQLNILNNRIMYCHQKLLSEINDDLGREIKLSCPYLLLTEDDVSDKVFFKQWLINNYNKRFTFSDIILYSHITSFYEDGNQYQRSVRSFMPQYSVPCKMNLRSHGNHLSWGYNSEQLQSQQKNKDFVFGRLQSISPYYFGNCHGVIRSWYVSTGLPQSEHSWNDGVQDGYYRQWFNKKDHLLETGNYRNGYRCGTTKKWYENRQLREESEYKDGKLHGWYKKWTITGQLERSCEYKNGY